MTNNLIYQCDFDLEVCRAKRYSIPELNFAIQDAEEAFKNIGSPKYSDQCSVYRMELNRRNLKGGK